MKLASRVLFLFFFLSKAYAVLDVESLPLSRTCRYPIGPYEKMVVFSAPRTGSSLIYNLARFLFELPEGLNHPHDRFIKQKTVLKTHRYNEIKSLRGGKILYLVPIRDPLNAAVSTYRITTRPVEDEKNFCKFLIQTQARHLSFAEKLKGAVLFIKYEDFENDLDSLIDFFERSFHISIDFHDRRLLKEGYSKNNIYNSVLGLKDFEEYLPLSGFHGKHVSLMEYKPSEQIIGWLSDYLEEYKLLFRKYGYFSE